MTNGRLRGQSKRVGKLIVPLDIIVMTFVSLARHLLNIAGP